MNPSPLVPSSAPPASEPATDRTVTGVVDYAAMERAVEDKISSDSLSLSYQRGPAGNRQHGHPAWVARGAAGQLIAVVSVHQLVVAIGSVPTSDLRLDGSDMWLWVSDAIVPTLG
jgi:hypothetical protein